MSHADYKAGYVRLWRYDAPMWSKILQLPPRLVAAFLCNGDGPYT